MVTVKMNGKHEVLSITIKPEAVDPDDIEMLEDMVAAAINATVWRVSRSAPPGTTALLPRNIAVGDVVMGIASERPALQRLFAVRRIVERSGLSYADRAPFADATLERGAAGAHAHLCEATPAGDPGDWGDQGPGAHHGRRPARQCAALPPPTACALVSMRAGGRSPRVFQWLREVGQVPTDDMLRTFNCGLGMIVVVAKDDAARVPRR